MARLHHQGKGGRIRFSKNSNCEFATYWVQQYAWVFTDGEWTVFRLTERRETDFLMEILGAYKGTVVSDFYGGYDALPYRQQKCLVHLIGDLNDDLWKNPFDAEFEDFVAGVRDLLIPIVACPSHRA